MKKINEFRVFCLIVSWPIIVAFVTVAAYIIAVFINDAVR